jgi:hypothetical protein
VLDGTALAHGLWTSAEKKQHITVLELVAVLRNVTMFLPRLKGKRVHLFEDNQAVCFILRQLTSRSRVIMGYLRELWALLQASDIVFGKVEYIRSAENPADAPSREKSWDEWRLCRTLFEQMESTYGPYTVDRFASRNTALCPRFNSLWVDPLAEGQVNAFSNQWEGEVNWIHPPISLLDDVALKLRAHPCVATVVAPDWPSYSWHRELYEMSWAVDRIPDATTVVDQDFLAHWGVRGPGSWPLLLFHVRP